MSYDDFGNFSGWSPKDHALNKIAFDWSQKNGGSGGGSGNNNNAGCAAVVAALVLILIICLISC